MPKQIKKGFGLQPLPEDNRDFSLGGVFGQIELSEIPNTDWLIGQPNIKHQGETDFCTAFATTGSSELQEGVELSPEYQFAKTKQLKGEFKAWGADLRSACKSAQKFGSLENKLSPHLIGRQERDFIANWKNWGKEYDEFATTHRKKAFFRVDTGRYDIFDNIRAALWQYKDEKRAVITGAVWKSIWQTAEKGIIPTVSGKGGFGHAFYFIGQKMIFNEPYLVAVNSYGKEVGDNGLFYFPREVVNRDFTFGSFQFQDVDPSTIKKIINLKGNNMKSKPYLQSQTIIGALKLALPVVFLVLNAFGVEVLPEEQAGIADNISSIIVGVLSLWGLWDVVVGRKNAKQPLKGVM